MPWGYVYTKNILVIQEYWEAALAFYWLGEVKSHKENRLQYAILFEDIYGPNSVPKYLLKNLVFNLIFPTKKLNNNIYPSHKNVGFPKDFAFYTMAITSAYPKLLKYPLDITGKEMSKLIPQIWTLFKTVHVLYILLHISYFIYINF